MSSVITPTQIKLFYSSKQLQALRSQKRYVFVCAGTGFGKTWLHAPFVYTEIKKRWKTHKQPSRVLVVAPDYKFIRDKLANEYFAKWFANTDLKGQYLRTPGFTKYNCADGSEIFFYSAQDPDKIEGSQYTCCTFDEAGQCDEHVWTVIQARLGFHQGRCMVTTTPYRKNWLYTQIYKEWLRANKDHKYIDFIEASSSDNPYYPKEELIRARSMLDPAIFRMRYEASFESLTGTIYPDIHSCVIWKDEFKRIIKEANGEYTRIGGVDWGFSDPFAALKAFIVDDTLIIYAERLKTQATLSSHVPFLGFTTLYYADSAGAQEIEECRKLGIILRICGKQIDAGIERVTALMRSGKLKIYGCPKLLEEASQYYRDEEGKLKGSDHLMDALRYLSVGAFKLMNQRDNLKLFLPL